MSQRAIRLLQPHTHAGKAYPAGALLPCHASDADWLVGQNVGEEEAPTPPAEDAAADIEPLALTAPTDTETARTGDDHE